MIRRHPLGAYVVLTFLLSWGYWIPLAIAGGGGSHFPGLLGPMLAALIVTGVVGGRAGLFDLVRRMGRWRVPIRWYAAALAPIAAAAVALVVLSVAGREPPTLRELSTMPGLPNAGWLAVLVMVFLINGYGEETGWRGYAWPRLRQRHRVWTAALLITVPWAIWHLPTFWLDTGLRDFPPAMIPGWLIGMVAGAVVLGWMYEHARSSIVIVALFHATVNLASATEGTASVAALPSVVIIVWAVLILRREHARQPTTPAGV